MKIKKVILIILLSAIFFSLIECRNKKTDLSIEPEIMDYSSMMSSVPGIPLNAKFKTNTKNDNVKFHWITEQGTFLKWQQDNGKIDICGKEVKTSEQKIYWSIDTNEKINESSFKIYLKVEDINNSSEVICETSIRIEQNKEGVFSIKK